MNRRRERISTDVHRTDCGHAGANGWHNGIRDHQQIAYEVERMRVFVTGSIAYDYIMVFPGRFQDHILPDKMHVLSVSFLVDSLTRRRGGTGANIAYNLGLLGETADPGGVGRGRFRRISIVPGVDRGRLPGREGDRRGAHRVVFHQYGFAG